MIGRMNPGEEDLVEISPEGGLRPLGERASVRLQARAGSFVVLPSPMDYLVLRKPDAPGAPHRPCLVSGEIGAPGGICDLFSFVAQTGWRGEFMVQEQTSTRSIFFEDGHVAGAQSNVVKERLGEVLYRSGVLTREQVDACSEASSDGKLRFGEAAVKLGFLAREALFSLMARQAEEIFFGTLLVANGTYFFFAGFDDKQLSSRHRLSVTTLVREGIRRMHEARYFRARIPSERHVPVRVPGRTPPDNDPLGVYLAVDGTRDVAELGRALKVGEFEVLRTLFQLVQSGHVAIRPPLLSPSAIVNIYNGAIALILRELDAMDEGDAVREQLATFAAQSPALRALLGGEMPADDGTVDEARVIANVERTDAPADAPALLASALHEYASYALFLARPHVRRMEEAREGRSERLSSRVSAILEPIAPPDARVPRGAKS
jgi:hypothetical protein